MKKLLLIGIACIVCASSEDVFTPTQMEKLQLENLQLRKRAMDAEYQNARVQLYYDVQTYVEAVTKAHPGAPVVFDMTSMAWVQKIGAAGATGFSGNKQHELAK